MAAENPDSEGAGRVQHRIHRATARLRSRVIPWDRSHTAIEVLRSDPRYANLSPRDALALFQKRAKLEVTGELDARTEELLRTHGGDVQPVWERLNSLQEGLAETTAQLQGLRGTLDVLLTDTLGSVDASQSLLVRLPVDGGPGRWLTFGQRRDLFVLKRLGLDGLDHYEPGTIATILALLDHAEGPFADVGANVGIFSLVIAACRPDIPVVAFEPTPDLADELRGLAAANGQEIAVEEIALGALDGDLTLFISPTDTSNSLREGFRSAVDEVEVPVRRLDTWVDGAAGPPPRVIKIDTESTEPDVLEGAEAFIAGVRPWLVVEVLKGRTEDALQAFCDRHDYTAHQIVTDGPGAASPIEGDPTYEHLNWMFAPSELPPTFAERFGHWQQVLDASLTLDRRPA